MRASSSLSLSRPLLATRRALVSLSLCKKIHAGYHCPKKQCLFGERERVFKVEREVLGKTRYSSNMSLTPSAALEEVKSKLRNAANVTIRDELPDSFVAICNNSNAGTKVLVKPTHIKVILDDMDAKPLRRWNERMAPYMIVFCDGQAMQLKKTSNTRQHPLVSYFQPLTEEGVANCVRLIRCVFEDAATRWTAA